MNKSERIAELETKANNLKCDLETKTKALDRCLKAFDKKADELSQQIIRTDHYRACYRGLLKAYNRELPALRDMAERERKDLMEKLEAAQNANRHLSNIEAEKLMVKLEAIADEIYRRMPTQ